MSSFDVFSFRDSKKWNELLSKLPPDQQDIYFTPEYYHLYEKLGDGTAKCFAYSKDNDIALYPFLLNSINALGFSLEGEYYDIQGAYGYNGIISSNYKLDFRISFFKAFNNYCHDNNIMAEFTRFHPILKNVEFSNNFMNIYKDRNTVFVDLAKTYDSIWKNDYSPKNRNKIRKAQKKQFTIEFQKNPSLENIKTFIDIYQNTMKAINASKYYLFNEEYFNDIFKFLEQHALLLKVINNENELECAAIVFVYGVFAHYHLSGRKRQSDNSVNNFILDEALKYAQTNGIKKIHLGGGNTSDPHDPLLQFKLNFSKNEGIFFIGKKIHHENSYAEVTKQWEAKYPEKVSSHKKIILKYRF